MNELYGGVPADVAAAVPAPLSGAAPAKKMHLPELDGIRGFAALSVAFHHLIATSIQPEGWPVPVQWLRSMLVFGAYGVDVFFVLSGFLITSLLLVDRESPNYYANFYWKRVLRILPLYLAVLLVVYLCIPGTGPYVLLSLLFAANFANVFRVESHGPFWTLAIEEQFYLVWPQIARRLPVSRLLQLALALCLLIPGLRIAATLFHHHNFWLTPFRCDGLAMGALLACQWHLVSIHGGAHVARLWWGAGRRAVLGGTILFLACAAGLGVPGTSLLAEALILSALALVTYGVIAYALTHPRSRLLWIFRARPMTFFGGISYCFYLCHSYILELYDHLAGPLPTGDVAALASRAAAVLLVATLLSVASQRLIELPAQSLRRYVLRQR